MPLQQLAAIYDFNVFVSLSCDDLPLRALQAVDARAEAFAYGIRSDTNGREVDIPATPAGKISYQLFGSAENLLDFAIHEGDVLEYLFRLQSGQARRVRNILGSLRASNLLLIGCRLPDWAGRSLLRLANNDSLQTKSTLEFLAENDGDPALTTFITRFSPNSLVFPGSASDFVAELSRRWQASRTPASPCRAAHLLQGLRQPPTAHWSSSAMPARTAPPPAPSPTGFSNSVPATSGSIRRSCAAAATGPRVDQAIAECDYFLPLLSSEADQRREGVFWEEWASALSRARRVADTFLLPTLIDADPGSRAHYQRIGREQGTEKFFKLHLFRAPAGVFDASAEDDLGSRFTGFRRS